MFLVLLSVFIQPVAAIEYTLPSVPESASAYMPHESNSFTEDLLYVFRSALSNFRPEITEADRKSVV